MVSVPDGDELPELHIRHHEVPLTEGVHAPVPLIGEPALVVLMVETWGVNITVLHFNLCTDLEWVNGWLFSSEDLPGTLAAKREWGWILQHSMSFEEAEMFGDIPEVSLVESCGNVYIFKLTNISM